MPELPEVEVIRLSLSRKIIGLKIQKIQILSAPPLAGSAKSFIGDPNLAEGQKVTGIFRKAKILGIELEKITLLIHLKMSGQLIYIPNDQRSTVNDKRFIGGHPTQDMLGKMPNSHTRVVFSFADDSHLYFNDQRKFGWIKAIENGELKIENLLGKLGPEPLEKTFTWEILKQNLLKHRNTPVKVALMDQSVVSGVGNIYSNEACFLAKIDPRIKVSKLTDKEFQALHKGVVESLENGIKYGGSTRVHFVDPEGHKGYFLDYAFVYGRDDKSCKVCKTTIKKIQLGGRGTYFCPGCQKSI